MERKHPRGNFTIRNTMPLFASLGRALSIVPQEPSGLTRIDPNTCTGPCVKSIYFDFHRRGGALPTFGPVVSLGHLFSCDHFIHPHPPPPFVREGPWGLASASVTCPSVICQFKQQRNGRDASQVTHPWQRPSGTGMPSLCWRWPRAVLHTFPPWFSGRLSAGRLLPNPFSPSGCSGTRSR